MSVENVNKLWSIAKELNVVEVANYVLTNEKFQIWSGSSSPHTHHYGNGGLAQHTLEVCELCLLNNKYNKSLSKDVDDGRLFLAALFHDVGKIWDYELDDSVSGKMGSEAAPEWRSNNHKKLIHHISRSVIEWNQAAIKCKLNYEHIDEVTHCILSHHGQQSWGSPVEPKTKMAWLLHLCDGISARLDDCDKRFALGKH
jgi:3'-5' exoribonuclease